MIHSKKLKILSSRPFWYGLGIVTALLFAIPTIGIWVLDNEDPAKVIEVNPGSP